MKQILARLALIACLTGGGVAALPASPASAFTGHGCTISACRYFTSSYATAKYFYDRQTCDQWKSLSLKYLHGFRTKVALHSKFPNRKLHPPC